MLECYIPCFNCIILILPTNKQTDKLTTVICNEAPSINIKSDFMNCIRLLFIPLSIQ